MFPLTGADDAELSVERPRPRPRDGSDPNVSDRSLLRRMRLGCQDAAAELYRRYAPRLLALARSHTPPDLARRLEPDDLVQSVFRRFVGQVHHGGCEVPEGSELWGLLLVVALNRIRAAHRFHRAGKRDVAVTRGELGLVRHLESHGRPGDAERAFVEVAVADVLEQLPPRHQQVARLRLAGYEVAEIGERLGRSLRTAERLLQECRTKLEVFFDDPT
ncbi:MAG: RNA polymerase sigma factor [Gemmataceae bacterium]